MSDAQFLRTLRLGDDGDKVDAITHVQQEFKVRLDYGDASNWRTVGDIYLSLEKALPAEVFNSADTWGRFCKAICYESGANAARVHKNTCLLAPPLIEDLARRWNRYFGRKS